MAYIPDDAIDASSQLTPSAFRLYALICRRRNHKTGHALLNRHSIANTLQLSRGQTWRAIAELKALQWITENEPFYVPLFGDFSPVDKWRRNDTFEPDQARKNETNARKNETESRKNARGRNIVIPDETNPFLPSQQKPKYLKRNWLCRKCGNKGIWYIEHSSKPRRCFDCDAYEQLELTIPCV